MTIATIKARVTVTTTVTTTKMRELPILDPETFDDESDYVVAELFDFGIRREDEVAIHARSLPPGCSARKPTGEALYTRVRSEAWLFETLECSSETRVLAVSSDGEVSLWESDAIVVVKLSDIASGWMLDELDEMHCPK